jgi:hypothetical protein
MSDVIVELDTYDINVDYQQNIVNVDKSENSIILENVNNNVIIEQESTQIIITDVGLQGPPGISAPSWIDVAGDVEYTGVEATITSGEVLTCSYKSDTIFRFINSTENTNGYPVEDSFYQNFDGTNLTNLLATRGV